MSEDGILRENVAIGGTQVRFELERKGASRARLVVASAAGGLVGGAFGMLLRLSPHARLAAAVAGAALSTALKGYRFRLEWDPEERGTEAR